MPRYLLDTDWVIDHLNKRAAVTEKRKVLGDFDLLIAATCLRSNLVLLTNNRRHFEVVEGLTILSPPTDDKSVCGAAEEGE